MTQPNQRDLYWEDAQRAFDALIGEVEAAGDQRKKTGWMSQAWHRRLTWVRWLKELQRYCENQHTMALARNVENDRLQKAFAAHAVQCPQCQDTALRACADALSTDTEQQPPRMPDWFKECRVKKHTTMLLGLDEFVCATCKKTERRQGEK